jgi:protoporphyrinogen IX oxidase
MLWFKAFHIISLICWFAGLFYLPRLYVYHADTSDQATLSKFKIMEWKLYWYITTPAAILTGIFGWAIIFTNYAYYEQLMWLHIKLSLVLVLYIFHIYLGKLLFDFRNDKNKHSQKFYRLLNEVPTVLLVVIVILAVVQP